ncbi:MAG: VIT domain-containing protein, partial [Candidatus Sumerlaeota bacterium]|nr:VIT domain-containing protein [Candidatus Sumerlaeota bacterium]
MKLHGPFASTAVAVFLFLASKALALGILVPTDQSVGPLQLTRHEVQADIDHQVARTKITQVFHNNVDRALEAYYLLPVPKGAQVTDFTLYIDGRPVKAEVMEREQARAIYEDIVRRMRDPGLMEYMDQNLMRVRIFPVPA